MLKSNRIQKTELPGYSRALHLLHFCKPSLESACWSDTVPSGKLEEGSGCVSPVTSARCSQAADSSAELGHNLNQLAISLLYQQQCPCLQYVCRYMRSSTDCHFVIQKMDLMAWSHVTQLSSSS